MVKSQNRLDFIHMISSTFHSKPSDFTAASGGQLPNEAAANIRSRGRRSARRPHAHPQNRRPAALPSEARYTRVHRFIIPFPRTDDRNWAYAFVWGLFRYVWGSCINGPKVQSRKFSAGTAALKPGSSVLHFGELNASCCGAGLCRDAHLHGWHGRLDHFTPHLCRTQMSANDMTTIGLRAQLLSCNVVRFSPCTAR